MKQILNHGGAVRDELERFLRAKQETASTSITWQTDVLDRLLPFAATGKLLRGSLLCFSYEAFSGRPAGKTVLAAAAALELTHSALLIHDDIMDNDDLRRGQPSFHRQYAALAHQEQFVNAEHFGLSMAMGAGDMALFLAYELLAGCPAGTVRLFTDQLAVTCAGQMQDLYLETRPEMPQNYVLQELMEAKTASYTLALPLMMGATLAKAPASSLARLRIIGLRAGVIFQIRDDELGVMGDTERTGKPVGSDIIEGKKTLLYNYLRQQCGAAERARLDTIFGNPAAAPSDIAYVQELVAKHGITKLLDDEIRPLEQESQAAIEKLAITAATKKSLNDLVRFCAERQS